jgi:hypothetical protein
MTGAVRTGINNQVAHFMRLISCAHGAGRARRGPVGQIGCYDAVQASGVGNRMCGDRSGGRVRRAGSESETLRHSRDPSFLQLELHRATRLNDFDLKPHTT